jgi:predicted nucleotidyltransferase
MEKHSLELIIKSLNHHQVRYLIAGGLAVVAHGYVRFTADVDVILAMDSSNLARAVAALKDLNYKPRAPVDFELFIDSIHRRKWIEEKGLTVFSLFSPNHPATEIDLFVDPPLVFADAYARVATMEIAPGIAATFCSLEDLIELKSQAARPRDLEDIARLNAIRRGADVQ